MTAEWEHFFTWLRVEDEKEKVDRDKIREQGTSLERVIDGLLPRPAAGLRRELRPVSTRRAQKIIAQNHQFIGVNQALERFRAAR